MVWNSPTEELTGEGATVDWEAVGTLTLYSSLQT